MKKWIFLVGIVLIAGMLSGCVESEEAAEVSSEDIKSISINESELYQTVTIEIPQKHWYSLPMEITTGRVIKITFRKTEPDIIVFNDETVKLMYKAEGYTWKLGKIYRITTKYDWFDGRWCIKNTKIIQEN